MDFCRMHLVYYDCWNSVWKAVFQDGKAFYAYHEAAIPLMQIET